MKPLLLINFAVLSVLKHFVSEGKSMFVRLAYVIAFLTISNCSFAGDPTVIDIVRASNAYAKAKAHYYKSNQNKEVWEELVVARKNLKGKTNKDLEFMEIMTLYRLKQYSPAYDQVLAYFEMPPWREQGQRFRNIETLHDDDVDYDAELTTVFADLEDWANLQKDINPTKIGTSVGKKFSVQLTSAIRRHFSSISLPSYSSKGFSPLGGDPGFGINREVRVRASIQEYKLERLGETLLRIRTSAIYAIRTISTPNMRTNYYHAKDTTYSKEAKYDFDFDVDLESKRATASFKPHRLSYWTSRIPFGLNKREEDTYGRRVERALKFSTSHRFTEAENLAYEKDSQAFEVAFFTEFYSNFEEWRSSARR